MGMYSWSSFGSTQKAIRAPRLTIRCDYPDQPPTEVSFRLSARYGIHDAREAHGWFLEMMREFEVETDRAGEWPVAFASETVRGVVVE